MPFGELLGESFWNYQVERGPRFSPQNTPKMESLPQPLTFQLSREIMKRILTLFALFGLLNACSSEGFSNGIGSVPGVKNLNCPAPPESRPQLMPVQDLEFYGDRFNFQIKAIQSDSDILRFQSLHYDFVYCRGNQTWTVQPGTFTPPKSIPWEEQQERLANPEYQTFEVNGESYRYRTYLDPNPFQNPGQMGQKAVFELIPPGQDQPILTTLYTLEALRKANIGNELADPTEVHPVVYRGRPLWVVSTYKGEGFSGIATFVSYDPQTQQVTLIQPPEIANQIVTDLQVADDQTLWMTTQMSGEGNPFFPGMGLVSYRPPADRLDGGTVKSYHVRNSPLIGSIPTQLTLEGDVLWVGTGSGICQVSWREIENKNSWTCWRFALMADPDETPVDLYESSQTSTPHLNITLEKPVEVLWWLPTHPDFKDQGRYEVRYEEGFTVTLKEGRKFWGEDPINQPDYLSPVYWPGHEWHWNGDRFVRGFDEVTLNLFGGGTSGIRKNSENYDFPPDLRAVRGDLVIREIQEESLQITYYSGWVEDEHLSPYLTILPVSPVKNVQADPLLP